MAGTLTHVFVSTHTESGSSIGLVSANEWNSSHAFSGTWDSSQITSVTAAQVTGTLPGSQVGTIGSSQVTAATSGVAFTSSFIATIGTSQISNLSLPVPSSQGGTGATTLGANGNLFYNNSSVVTAISGSSFNGSNQLTLTSMNLFVNGEIVNTAIDLQIHQGLGGL